MKFSIKTPDEIPGRSLENVVKKPSKILSETNSKIQIFQLRTLLCYSDLALTAI